MGCGASVDKPTPKGKVKKNLPKLEEGVSASLKTISDQYSQTINKQCPRVRLDHPEGPKTFPVRGRNFDLDVSYCYISQRGYYPTEVGKANQDSYVICESIMGDTSCHLFGVFDGHGEFGDYCSHFCADKFPMQLVKGLREQGGVDALDSRSKANDVLTRAFLDTNFALNKSSVEDLLSGTTGITLLMKGDKLIVSNVGDSRAIIATENEEGKLVYSPLSNDQTPYRKDERERVKKAGGKIMTYEQLDGNEPMHENWGTSLGEEIDEGGDPPRVWDATLEKPGCAFTRSLGDGIAKTCGVCADPEILEWEITPSDKFAVVASDGVFEFITSQSVVDMITKYSTSLEAAKHVVAEAYRLWLTYDDRTDDITMIIINFDNIRQAKQSIGAGEDPRQLSRAMSIRNVRSIDEKNIRETNRPVRKVMSRSKRKDISENFVHDDNEEKIDFAKIENTKTQEELMRISKMLSTNFLFENLTPVQKDNIYKVMVSREVKQDEAIIREGDQGDAMYIVDSGEFGVYKRDDAGVDQLLFVYTTDGSAFGELSLMYGKPRAASIIAHSPGRLWSIGRSAFRAVIMKGRSEGLLQMFKTIPLLSHLNYPQLHRLCMDSTEKNYEKGEIILDEAKAADIGCWAVGVVLSGTVRLLPREEGTKRQLRSDGAFVLSSEVGGKFRGMKADHRTRIICIPKDALYEVLDQGKSQQALEVETAENTEISGRTEPNQRSNSHSSTNEGKSSTPKSFKGKRNPTLRSAFVVDENLRLQKNEDFLEYKLEYPVLLQGDYAYVGKFRVPFMGERRTRSVKVIAKSKAMGARMDARMLQERQYLAALTNLKIVTGSQNSVASPVDDNRTCILEVESTFQDPKMVYLEYKEDIVCELSLALSNGAVKDDAKPFYLACIYSALNALHMSGLIHRFINPGAFYITASGVPKLADLRYAKQMDGSRSYTICGDPLFFAPEIVGQMGYDYAADLWAFGVLFYEFYEGCNPFGSNESEETDIFQNITGFHFNKLEFKSESSTSSVTTMIRRIMDTKGRSRLGYKSSDAMRSADFFKDIDWATLGLEQGHHPDIEPSIDIDQLFGGTAKEDILPFSNDQFDQF